MKEECKNESQAAHKVHRLSWQCMNRRKTRSRRNLSDIISGGENSVSEDYIRHDTIFIKLNFENVPKGYLTGRVNAVKGR